MDEATAAPYVIVKEQQVQQALYQTAIDLALYHELPDLLQAIIDRAVALIGGHSGAIGLYDSAYDEIELTVQTGVPLPFKTRRRRGDGMAGQVIETRSPLIVHDYLASPYAEGVVFYTETDDGAGAAAPPLPPLMPRAVLNVPMLYRDELLGVLSLYEMGESPRRYNEQDARLVAALAAVGASAVKNARLRLEAQQRAEMERIVASIATRFINLELESINSEIDNTLRLIGLFAGVDRSYLFRIRGNLQTMTNTHEWCAERIASEIDNLQNLDCSLMPWLTARLAQGLVTNIRSLDELPPAAAIEREILASQDIKSVILIPIMVDGQALGFIGFDAVRGERMWGEQDVSILKLIAEVFALALDRAHAEHTLRMLNQELEHRVAERTAALREAEAALKAALAEERELGELKSRFVATASHEFRTPLAAILANAETLLAYRDRLDEQQTELRLNRICGQVKRLSNIVDQVLTLTRAQGGRITPVLESFDVAEFCCDAVEEFSTSAPIGCAIDFTLDCGDGESCCVVADRKLLHTAFTNILSNAVKYSPHGGVIEVRVVAAGGSSSGSAGGAVDGVAGVASAGAVCVRVEDHGIGIPEADQPRLFQPFHRAGNVGSLAGTGLGLSIAKEMIELMHGAIGFQSKVGEGTCFEFTLPPALAPCSPAEAV